MISFQNAIDLLIRILVYIFSLGLNSSADSSNPSQTASSSSPPSTDSLQPQSLIERYSAKHTSKIPIPVLSKNRSRPSLLNNVQQRAATQMRETTSQSNGAMANNSKVDQIIADLLIEALNHSTDIGIEFIKAPKHPQSKIKLNQTIRTTANTSRRANGMAVGGCATSSGGKRSSHGSAKYQQMFAAIPEEKSGSLSIESPNEENDTPTDGKTEIDKTTASSPSANGVINQKISSPKQIPSNGVQVKMASGKVAIESDQVDQVWFGCFGRTHVDSPAMMDEGIFKIVHSTSLAV